MSFFVKKIVNSILCLLFLLATHASYTMSPSSATPGADECETVNCMICLEPEAAEGLFVGEGVMPCPHKNVHARCLEEWLKHGTNCPLCRAPIIGGAMVDEEGSAVETTVSSDWEIVDPATVDPDVDDVVRTSTVYGAWTTFRRVNR